MVFELRVDTRKYRLRYFTVRLSFVVSVHRLRQSSVARRPFSLSLPPSDRQAVRQLFTILPLLDMWPPCTIGMKEGAVVEHQKSGKDNVMKYGHFGIATLARSPKNQAGKSRV